MRNILFLFAIGALLLGCSTTKILQATGGSKADGVVELSYEYGSFESPVVDWDAGLRTATQRCSAWGYKGAEPFGGVISDCQAYNDYGCVRWFVTAKYQCLDTGMQSSNVATGGFVNEQRAVALIRERTILSEQMQGMDRTSTEYSELAKRSEELRANLVKTGFFELGDPEMSKIYERAKF